MDNEMIMQQVVSKNKKFFTVKQFVEYIGTDALSTATIYLMIKRGQVPVVQANKRLLIPADWVHEFCNSASYKVAGNEKK